MVFNGYLSELDSDDVILGQAIYYLYRHSIWEDMFSYSTYVQMCRMFISFPTTFRDQATQHMVVVVCFIAALDPFDLSCSEKLGFLCLGQGILHVKKDLGGAKYFVVGMW